jgi:hypothetical protein
MIKVLGNIELPNRLYKYRDWKNDYHKTIISKQIAFLASPGQFNDPFDCKIPIRYDINSEQLLEDIYYRTIKAVHKDRPDSEIRAFAKKQVNEGQVDPKSFKKNGEEYFSQLDKRMGIMSVSARNNDILMWGHYANSHSGFCIGLDTSEILKMNGIDFIGKVNYCEELPKIIPTGNLTEEFEQQIFTKWNKWEYEAEYRLTKNHIGNRKIQIPKTAFKEVILGYNMSEVERRKLVKLAKKQFPEIHIFEAKPNEEKFSIDITRIE